MNKTKTVAIIGGGASGLLCAIFCAKGGVEVDVFEQNSKCAKKILASGNGRCNITNKNVSSSDYFSQNPSFVEFALREFGYEEFKKFSQSIGLLLDEKEDGRVYPLSNEAKSVASTLINYAKSLGVNFYTDTKITDIKALFKKYDSVVVATGSCAASHLGGSDDGLRFAKEFGHNIIPIYPSLVQLHLASLAPKKMSGVRVDAVVTLYIDGKKEQSISGDVLFSDYGVSGFAVLDISQSASLALLEKRKVEISLNLLSGFDMQKLSSHIQKIASNIKNFTILDILNSIVPSKVAQTLLDELKIPLSITSDEITVKIAKNIANTLLNWRFEVNDTHGFRHAEVAGGGVDTTEINPKTMESLKQKNLYFCGEVLDVVGRRGGYNFAFAWASGYLAARDIAKSS
ncbi:MAG: NAD(P)/FAD-dependent oxidoreductase [Sulfurimonas sp.]|uniref:NAD(P)/FAD-dependent oxidoreductase n=1 Tax=Sulfurimonas sp. TaxID=2022749 RepID=UPI0026221450|nr:NAD(P)/FAD-dependent oxidoreductase [Sulfurimonas sp.]MDD2652395.1 NAD(P)/FAD-dependent oxidoreductase [Sulfurimonas sp.]MDD3451129.1 NAD(P)/FAD-dependent oxidoreductase [Sulfurimonas sp.]